MFLTLALLAGTQQRVQASHQYAYMFGFGALGAAVGAAIVWLSQRNGDDPPEPSTQAPPPTARSTPWRPLPAMAHRSFEKHFGIRVLPGLRAGPAPAECLPSRETDALASTCGVRTAERARSPVEGFSQ